MSIETAAIEALNIALTTVYNVPRPEWKRDIWQDLKEFCEQQLGEKK